jgi:4-methyl-5(b-hydroxyethyl)-thiazole monophosphate biosynthesis
MSTRVLVPLADGFEEIEAFTVVDILRRAGADVVTAGVEGKDSVTGRSSITAIPDTTLDRALDGEDFDLVVLPGGLPAAFTLRDDPRIVTALGRTAASGGRVAAICAAPVALERAGLLDGVEHTSHPTLRDQLPLESYSEKRVVTTGRIVTSRAAGTAMEFAFTLVRELFGEEKVREVNQGVLARI